MRMRSLVLAFTSSTALFGLTAAHADEDGWRRRHEWREHHWDDDHRDHRAAPYPDRVYIGRPDVYYVPPAVQYAPIPRVYAPWHGREFDDEE